MISHLEQTRNMWLTKLRIGDLAYERGDFRTALTSYEAAHHAAEELAKPDCISVCLVKKAICMSALNRMDEAESLIRKANTLEATGVLDGNEAGLLHHEFSVLLFRLGRFDEGLREEEKALELLNKAENADCQLTVLVLKQLAVYMTLEKQFQVANSLLEDAIRVALSASTIGKDSLLHGQLLATQAILRINEHKFEEARQLHEHAIMLIELHEGQFNPKLADLYKIFAKHLTDAGQAAEAEHFLNRARLVSEHKKLTMKIW